MKFSLGIISAAIVVAGIFAAILFQTFPSGRVLKKWNLDAEKGISIELREGEIALNRLPFGRRGIFYLVGANQRSSILPVFVYLDDAGECRKHCQAASIDGGFEVILPNGGRYFGRYSPVLD